MCQINQNTIYSSMSVGATLLSAGLTTVAIIAAVGAATPIATLALSIAAFAAGCLLLLSIGSNVATILKTDKYQGAQDFFKSSISMTRWLIYALFAACFCPSKLK